MNSESAVVSDKARIALLKELSPDLQTELRQFLLALADTKRALGLRYAEWCDRAPTLEAGVAASAMAQDQLGQARVLYALIQELPDAPRDLDDETRPHRSNLEFLDHPFPTWATFVAANLLIGSAVTLAEEALADSRLAPLRARIPKMLEEERFHRVHAYGWFEYFQASDGERAAVMRGAISKILPQVLCWFGDAQHAVLSDEVVLTLQPYELRERYLERLGPMLQSTGLVKLDERTGTRAYTGSLPWSEFDPVTRRIQHVSGQE